MKKEPMNLLHQGLKRAGELAFKLCWEERLVIDGLLGEGHHIIYVLGGSHLALLPFLIKPQVLPISWAGHVGAAGHGAKL